MPDEIADLDFSITALEASDDDFIDPRRLSCLIDRLVAKHSKVLHRARVRGDWRASGLTAVSWAARVCGLSRRSAADRMCVGKHLESLSHAVAALHGGEIGYQAASSMSHLRENLGDRWPEGLESDLVGYARNFTAERFRFTCRHAHHAIDPDGFDRLAKQDFERRWLEINTLLDGMYSVDGILDSETGSAFKAALEALATPRGPEDTRTRGQRTADALGEWLQHDMSSGRLPRKKGVRPHITLTTTLAALKSEVGTPAAELESGIPITNCTVERVACDSTVSRVLLADSVVIDVGRATRSVQPATRRALNKRDGGCRFPGCDRPVSWSSAHHIQFWGRGGKTELANLILLCHYHHRLVHEEAWQVVRAGERFQFIPPEHLHEHFAREPDMSWAA